MTMLADIAHWRAAPRHGLMGIPSMCTAHPLALEAAMRVAQRLQQPLLVEATCNQVHQHGGYTGMRPADFVAFVGTLADKTGLAHDQLIFGGDHLGPNPWKHLAPDAAMDQARAMVAAYAAAGFSKLHLDCSMPCAGEPAALDDETIARRAAQLARVAEAAVPAGAQKPLYIIGTEVPAPGGVAEELQQLEVTRPEAAFATYDMHRAAFAAAGLEAAFGRVIALVVQPGVEFGNHNIIDYAPDKARALSAALGQMPGLVFEAHSTDYQTPRALAALVQDGFAILKVGPGLTFALRTALYALDAIATVLRPGARSQSLPEVMEQVMLQDPSHWQAWCPGSPAEQALQRHHSWSDRIRYYWAQPRAQAAVHELLACLDGVDIPQPLMAWHMAGLLEDVRAGKTAARAPELLRAAVQQPVQDYYRACRREA